MRRGWKKEAVTIALSFTWLLMQPVIAATQTRETGSQTSSKTPEFVDVAQPGTAVDARSSEFAGDRRPLYRLATSDVLELTFDLAPEYNQTLTILPDGFIAPRGTAELHVQGHTLAEVRQQLNQAYAGILNDPNGTVALKDFEKPYFIAAGQVARPGKYELRGETTVSEAMAIAGGTTEQSRHSQVVLFRRVTDDVVEAHVLNLKKMLQSKDLNEEVRLRPRDLIFVPQNTISKIRRYLPVPSLGMYMNSGQF